MSEPLFATGQRRDSLCPSCGSDVEQYELLGNESTVWRTVAHKAPCGLPCYAGGIDGKDHRTDHYHRHTNECPACKAKQHPSTE